MNVKNKILGLVFFLSWLLIGVVVTTWTAGQFIMAPMGGVFEPPAIQSLARDLGLIILPYLLILGGAPAAIQIMRGHPWKVIAMVIFAICAVAWLTLMIVVIWKPAIFGWSW